MNAQASTPTDPAPPYVRLEAVTKKFGEFPAVDAVSLDVRRGEIFCLLGGSGSGKTTLLRVLAGLAAPTAGELELPDRAVVGYLGHEPLVYRELTPLESLHLFARLYRISERGERIGMLLERFGLWDVRRQRVQTFSRGMQQRLGLCRLLLHDPAMLVLDEPFNALDAAGAELLDETLAELRDCAIIVATHDPGRVESLATQRLAFG